MEQAKIDRINALARLAKERDLTEEELTERQALRAEYIASYKRSLVSQLESTYIVDEQGNKTKVTRREEKE